VTGTPSDWALLPLGVIASFRLGGNYQNNTEPSRRPLIKMGNIARVNIDLRHIDYVPDSETVLDIHRLRYGDVLFNTRNTLDLVGKVSIWRDELPLAYYNSNILRLDFDPKYCGDSRYFGYALNSKYAISAIRALATGTTSVAAVYTRDLLKLELAVPPAGEQAAIASVLNDADALLAALDRLISKKRAIRQGMAQQLLTGKTRLPGFTGVWMQTTAGSIGTFRGGNGFPLRFQGAKRGKFPFFKVSDMNRAANRRLMRAANNYISEGVRKQLGATAFPAHAIVFAKVGAAVFLERKRILETASCIDNNMAAMVVDPASADYRFVHYALEALRMSSLVATTALPSLNGTQLRSIRLCLPADLGEQAAIASVLADADAEIDALRLRLEKGKAIKHGMAQQLLTGKTRLSALEAVT
jgi:type I restriction enzyme, S subunit